MPRTRHDERRWTIEEYARLDEGEEVRTELVGGRLVREPRPAAPHGRTQARLARRLDAFVEERELGVVMTDVGVVLDPEGPTVRGPDVLFVSHERLPSPLPEGFLEVAPDLVVEVVSPSNAVSEVQAKVLDHLEAGTREVWVVDPGSRTATVYRSRHDAAILGEDEELEGGEVLPGFRVPLEDVLP